MAYPEPVPAIKFLEPYTWEGRCPQPNHEIGFNPGEVVPLVGSASGGCFVFRMHGQFVISYPVVVRYHIPIPANIVEVLTTEDDIAKATSEWLAEAERLKRSSLRLDSI